MHPSVGTVASVGVRVPAPWIRSCHRVRGRPSIRGVRIPPARLFPMPHTLVLLSRQRRMEPEEPVHRLGRRATQRHRPRGGASAGELLAEQGVLPDVQHTSVLTGRSRPRTSRSTSLTRAWIDVRRSWRPQRASLRRAAGPRQGRDPREVRRRAVPAVAPLVRRPAAGARRRRRVVAGRRPALREPPRRRAAPHGVPEGRHRAHAAVLGVRHHPRPRDGQGRCSSRRTATRCARS